MRAQNHSRRRPGGRGARPRAQGRASPGRGRPSSLGFPYLLLLAFLAFLLGSHLAGYTPAGLLLLFLLPSAIAYRLYARDKAAAIRGEQRVPEKTLQLAAGLGGWPGALLAQRRLRHKTRKTRFQLLFWLLVLLNLGTLGWLHAPQGNRLLRAAAQQVEALAVAYLPYEGPRAGLQFLLRFRDPDS